MPVERIDLGVPVAGEKARKADEFVTLSQLPVSSQEANGDINLLIPSGLGDSVGVSMGDKFLSGFKSFIKEDEHVIVPAEYEYNGFNLAIDGVLEIEGVVNLFNEDSSENSFDDYYTKIEIDEMIGDIETLLEAL